MDLATRVFPVQVYDRPRSRISATKIRVSAGSRTGYPICFPREEACLRAPAANQQDRADVRAITSAASPSSPEPLPSKASLRVITPPPSTTVSASPGAPGTPPRPASRRPRQPRRDPARGPAGGPARRTGRGLRASRRGAARGCAGRVGHGVRVLLPAGGVARQGCVELGVLGYTREDDVTDTLVGGMELGGVREEVSGSVRFAGAMVPLTAVLASVLVMFAPSSRYNGGKPTSSHARLRSAGLTVPGTPTSKEPAGPFSRNRHRRTVSSTNSKHVVHEMSSVISFPFHYNPSGLLAYFAGQPHENTRPMEILHK